MRIEDFKPEVFLDSGERAYATMMVELNKCPLCRRYMLYSDNSNQDRYAFPKYEKINFETQVKKSGWVVTSDIEVNNHFICQDCVKSGKAEFTCSLCNVKQPTSKIQETIGVYDKDYLCQTCYNTKTAKEWEEKTEELYEKHRWDSE
jgi:hypothetical protein